MKNIIAVMMVGLFVAGAQAQSQTTRSTTSEASPVTDSKSQIRAEERKANRKPGAVKIPESDMNMTGEGNPIASNKAVRTGEERQRVRKENMGAKRLNPQGGTPE